MMRVNGWTVIGTLLPAIAGWWLITPFLGRTSQVNWPVGVIAVWLFACALVRAARKLNPHLWICAGLVVPAALFLPPSVILGTVTYNAYQPSDSQTMFTLLLTFPPALIVAAMLIYSGWRPCFGEARESTDPGRSSRERHPVPGRTARVALILAALLLAAVVYHYYWFIVWDTTGDSLGVLWLIFLTLAILFSSGPSLALLPGQVKLVSASYLLIIPILLADSALAERVDFRQLTEERAAQTSQAIKSYYAREGCYPPSLAQLFPRDALSLPGPVILCGQDWCYDGGYDYYRLGYVYREHWSDPRLFGRLYETEGPAPNLPALCSRNRGLDQALPASHCTLAAAGPRPLEPVFRSMRRRDNSRT